MQRQNYGLLNVIISIIKKKSRKGAWGRLTPPPPHLTNNVMRDEHLKKFLRSENLLLIDIIVDSIACNENLKLF